MDGALAWFGHLVEALGKFIPRLIIIRATHKGVKWRYGNRVISMEPGLHFYWPITTEVEVLVTARQTLAIADQVLTTCDGRHVTLKTLVVYRIRDIIKAIGKANWDVDSSLSDLTQSAVVHVITTHTHDEIMRGIADQSLTKTLTLAVRRELRQFGVHISRCKLVDFSECRVYKVMTSQTSHQGLAHAQFYS